MRPAPHVIAEHAVTLNGVQSLIVAARQEGPRGRITIALQLSAYQGGEELHPAVIELPARALLDTVRALNRLAQTIGVKR